MRDDPGLPRSGRGRSTGSGGPDDRKREEDAGSAGWEEISYQRYLAALLDGETQVCREEFQAWLDREVPLPDLYRSLVRRSLYEIGEMWAADRISVATEHLATAITESLLNLAYPRLFARPRLGPRVVVSCTANEHHQIGGKIVADMFEWHGWRSHFLGANSPLGGLLSFVRERKPDAVALSATVPSSLAPLREAVVALRELAPAVPILVGGQALVNEGPRGLDEVPGVSCLLSSEALDQWLAPP